MEVKESKEKRQAGRRRCTGPLPLGKEPVALLVDELPAFGNSARSRLFPRRQPVGADKRLYLEDAADFLLDTTRAAYLLVRGGIVRRYPGIRVILSHAGGFVPYASHRMAVAIAGETGRSPLDVLDDFRSFYFDTALSSSPAALPTLLAFARPGHILFGSDWPFAPTRAGQYFANGLDDTLGPAALMAVNRTNATALFPRLAARPAVAAPQPSATARIRHTAQRTAARLAFKLVQPGTNQDGHGA